MGKKNSKQSIPNKTITAWRNRANINKTSSCKKHKKNNKINGYPLSAVDRRCKTKEKTKEKILTDEEKDENYLNTLNDEFPFSLYFKLFFILLNFSLLDFSKNQ